jgi:hypothetical protein
MSTPNGNAPAMTADRPTIITTRDEFVRAYQRWQAGGFNLLCPFAGFSALAPQHGLVASVVKIDPNPEHGEVYLDPLFCREGEVAIGKVGLSKIAQAAGISIVTEWLPASEPYLWRFRATGLWRGITGEAQVVTEHAEYDLRDGSPITRNWKPNQIQSARAHGLRHCEARAVNAVIRQFGVKQKYQVSELAKPFLVVRVMFLPDLTDPETRRIVTQQALGATALLYPPPAVPTLAPREEAVVEPAALPRETPRAEVAPASASSRASQIDHPAASMGAEAEEVAEPVLTVRDVRRKVGTTQGRQWVRSVITFSDGREAVTFDTRVAEAAQAARDAGLPVRARLVPNERYPDLLDLAEFEVIEAGQVALPLAGDDL